MEFDYRLEIAENKLALLYMIDRISEPVPGTVLMQTILEGKFMSYLDLQQALSELTEQKYISLIQDNTTRKYILTDDGKEILTELKDMVTPYVVQYVSHYAPAIKKQNQKLSYTSAEYRMDDADRYSVRLSMHEKGSTILEIRITVYSKNDAINLCNTFENNATAISSEILASLLKDRPAVPDLTDLGSIGMV